MTAQEFFDRSIDWLRAEQKLRTDVIAGSHLDDSTGSARLDGFFARTSKATRLALIGLWVVTFGVILAMTNLPGFTPETRVLFERIGMAVTIAGASFWVVAEVVRRRERTRAIVELRAASADALTADAIAALHDAARGAEAWCVAEGEVPAAALAAASKRGVRCFAFDGTHFREPTS